MTPPDLVRPDTAPVDAMPVDATRGNATPGDAMPRDVMPGDVMPGDAMLGGAAHRNAAHRDAAHRDATPGNMTPEGIAALASRTMWEADRASRNLGMELLDVGPGRARLAMVIRPDMVNGHGLAHGGFIFTLADSTFAYACNSHGISTVAAHCGITYLKPAKEGDRLVAEARTITEGGRSGLTDVTVRTGSAVIAEFRGYSRAIGGSFLPVTPEPEG